MTGTPFDPNRFERPGRMTAVLDVEDRPLILFDSDWALNRAIEENPTLAFTTAVQPGRGRSPAPAWRTLLLPVALPFLPGGVALGR